MNLNDTQGVTLIEIMIALLIFTVGMLAVASMQGVGMVGIAKAQRGIYNSVAAGGRLEHLLAVPFDDPFLVDKDNGFYPETPDHGPFLLDDGRSTMEWEVADDSPVPGAKRIRVTVRRPDRGGVTGVFAYEYVRVADLR